MMFNASGQAGPQEGKIGRVKFASAPGLSLKDEKGHRTAKQSGWILSYTNWDTLNNDDTYLDFKKTSLNDAAIKHFANALIRLVGIRNNTKITMSSDEREALGGSIFEEMT